MSWHVMNQNHAGSVVESICFFCFFVFCFCVLCLRFWWPNTSQISNCFTNCWLYHPRKSSCKTSPIFFWHKKHINICHQLGFSIFVSGCYGWYVCSVCWQPGPYLPPVDTCHLPNQQATARAFAALLKDGDVVTWGDRAYGGNSARVHEHLRNVRRLKRKTENSETPIGGMLRVKLKNKPAPKMVCTL